MTISKKSLLIFLMIFIPIIVNLTIYSLPENIKQNFILKTNDITLLNLYLTHFTHLEWEHLRDNLILYLLFSISSFLLLFSLKEENKFVYIFPLIVFVSPFLISISWVLIFKGGYFLHLHNIVGGETKGFSGIVACIFGLLIVNLSNYIHKKTSIEPKFLLCIFILIESLYVPLIYFKWKFIEIMEIILILFLIFLLLWFMWKDAKNKDTRPLFDDLKSSKVKFWIFYSSLVIIVLGTVLLFPQNIGDTDILMHYLGLVFGLLLSVLVLRSWGERLSEQTSP